MALSTETEGFQVARALANRGIAAFVLEYRLVPTPVDRGAVPGVAGWLCEVCVGGAVPAFSMPLRFNP